MSCGKLVKRFADLERLPIDLVEDVEPEFINLGVKDKVWYWPDKKLDPNILRGKIEHWEYPESENGPVVRCADITYSAVQEPEWQRLVCCKELLHIVDPAFTRSSTAEEIDELIEKIILPPEFQDAVNDGINVNIDRNAITVATAILFPYAVRELFLEPYTRKVISVSQIAEAAELPPRYIALAMSDYWPTLHSLMLKI